MITESTTEVDYADFKLLAAETEVRQTSEGQNKNDTDTLNVQQSENSEQPVKRKRGRPKLSESKRKKVQFVKKGEEMEEDGESFINALSLKPEQGSKQGYKRPRGRPKMSDILKKIYQSTGKMRGRPRIYKQKGNLVRRPRGRPRLIGNHTKVDRVPSSKSKTKNSSLVNKSVKWKAALCVDTEDQDPDVTILRLTGRHFPDRLATESMCHVCKGNGIERETDICCNECTSSPPLCTVPCFRIYHTTFRYLAKGENTAQSINSGPQNVVKRPRGRPKRQDFGTPGFYSESVPEQNAVCIGLENNTIVKKQRGRPKKKNSVNYKNYTEKVSDVNTDFLENSTVGEFSNKKRGRPKRNSTIIPNLYLENISDSEDEKSFVIDEDVQNSSGRPVRRNTITPTIYAENSSDSEIEENCFLSTMRSSNEYETDSTKRPRGRPKKEKKPRGRPRKNISTDQIDVDIVYEKEISDSEEGKYETETKSNTSKRGRGRPRKEWKPDPLTSAISQSNGEDETLSSDDE